MRCVSTANTVRGALANPATIADLERYIGELERVRTVTESRHGLQTNRGHLSGGKQVNNPYKGLTRCGATVLVYLWGFQRYIAVYD